MHEIHLTCGGIHTRLQAVAEGIIRVSRTCAQAFLPMESPVVQPLEGTIGSVQEKNGQVLFTVGGVTVVYAKATGALRFEDDKGRLLLRENDRRPCVMEAKPVYLSRFQEDTQVQQGQSVDGVRAWAEPVQRYQDRMAYECRNNFVFGQDEGLYGLGSHEEGYGNLRGRMQLMYQHNMKAVVPVLLSTKGWGMLFDMGCLMAFHDDAQGSYLWADCADELDWYFFYGDGTYAAAMEKYRLLTGETPMLPRYSLGYIQSKERYVDAAEITSVAEEYRRRQVPLDMVVLDWQSWPENQWGWKTFDTKRFPDTAKWIDWLHKMDVRLMLSIWPSMQGDQNADLAEMLQNGCMLGNRLIYNAFDPKARALYWKQARENLFSKGVDAWWCDCTEPFESDWRGPVRPEPMRRAQLNTDEAKRYLDPAKINLYSLYHSQGIYHGQRSVTEDKRVCNLTRSSYAGQHRYATVTWSGDVSASWEVLRRHVPEGMNFCATGEGYWSTDIGGFFPNGNWEPWFYEGDFDDGMDDLGYRELFVRWAQYAAFLPMMRAHGTGTPREIWRLGEKGTPFYDAMEKTIRLRYRLVPYLYSLMAKTNRTGLPMLRVPALVFPADAQLQRLDDQMMLGDGLLVKPVTHPIMYQSHSQPVAHAEDTVSVYLPEGSLWHDLHTGRCYQGGQRVEVHAPLDVIPMFARAGAIIPWGGEAQHTGELAALPLEITVYPGADGTFCLYDDAGDGYGYEKGEYALVPLNWDDAQGILTIGERQGWYPGMAKEQMLRIHCTGCEAIEITYTGEAVCLPLLKKESKE